MSPQGPDAGPSDGGPGMRVLLVNDLPPGRIGGAEQYLERLIGGLEAAGDVVDVFAGEVVHRGVAKMLDVWDPRAARLVAERARTFDADVVHHHNVARELSASVFTATPDRATVVTLHDHRLLGVGDVPDRGVAGLVQRHVKRPLDRRVAVARVDAAIAVSSALAARARDAGFEHVVHVPQPGRLPTAELQDVRGCRDVLFAGRLSRDKGVLVLLEAFTELVARFPDVRLRIAGDGPERDAVRAAAGRLAGRVDVLGALDQARVSAELAAARVVVIPSLPVVRPEGASLVTVEAALHGRPVVVGEDPAVREVADALGGAVTVAPCTPATLADAIARLLADDGLAARLGDTARRAALERHDPVRVAERVRLVHRDAMTRAARRG